MFVSAIILILVFSKPSFTYSNSWAWHLHPPFTPSYPSHTFHFAFLSHQILSSQIVFPFKILHNLKTNLIPVACSGIWILISCAWPVSPTLCYRKQWRPGHAFYLISSQLFGGFGHMNKKADKGKFLSLVYV